MARTLILKVSLDEGLPGPEHFEIRESPTPVIGDGVIVMLLTVSADPYMRYRIRSDGDYKPGEPMLGLVAGKILDSKVPEWKIGDLFGAELPYTDVQAVSARKVKSFRRLTGLISEDQISLGIGALWNAWIYCIWGIDRYFEAKERWNSLGQWCSLEQSALWLVWWRKMSLAVQ